MPLIISLLSILLITTCQPAKAMFPGDSMYFRNSQPQHQMPQPIWLDSRWRPALLSVKLPRQIAIFDKQTAINDELLAKLNPEWQKLSHTLSRNEMNELFKIIYWYPGGDHSDHIKRCLYAQAIATGADPSTELEFGTALYHATLKDDYELAKYVLEKLIQGQRKFEQEAFRGAKSVRMAELFLLADVPIPEDILDVCITQKRPIGLMKFYLQKGANQNGLSDSSFSALHCCTFEEKSRVYVPLLLDAGADMNIKNGRDYTIFHEALKRNNSAFCECVVDYFLMKEKAVIISYLGCLKKRAPRFYIVTKDLHQALFRNFPPLDRLEEALEIKDNNGQIAYQMKPLEILNPVNCTYAKLKQLRRKSMEFTSPTK